MSVFQKCPLCEGSGISPVPGTYSGIPVCPTCDGKRIIDTTNGLPPGIMLRVTNVESNERHFKGIIRFVLQQRLADPECTIDDMWNIWANTNNL